MAPIPLPPALPLGAVVAAPPVMAPAPRAMAAAVLLEETAAIPVVVPVAALAVVAALATTVNTATPAPQDANAAEVGAGTGIPMATAMVIARRHRTRPRRLADPVVANATRSRISLSTLCLRLAPSRNGRTTFT